MKKWLVNKLVDISLEKEVRNEHGAEVERLQSQINRLEGELVPISKVIYNTIVAVSFRGDKCVISTHDDTFPIRLENKTEFKAFINRLIPKDLKNLEVDYPNKTCKFYLKLYNPLFAKYLPTTSFMRLADNNNVEIQLDFKEMVNVTDIRNFADVVLGRIPVVKDEETYRNVFKASLREMSTRYGLELVSETLDTIDFDTPMYTQVVIRPVDEPRYKPLRIDLAKFYQDDSLRNVIKDYIRPLLAQRQDKATLENIHIAVQNFLAKNKLDEDFYHSVGIVNGKIECELMNKKSGTLKPFLIELGNSDTPPSQVAIHNRVTREFTEQLRQQLQNRLGEVYNKYKDRIPVPYTKQIIISGVVFHYTSGIDGRVQCRMSDIDIVLKWYELELQLLMVYGIGSIKKITFMKGVTTNVKAGVISDDIKSREVLSYFFKPYQLYQQAKYLSEQPKQLDETDYVWCNFTQSFKQGTLEVTLDNYPNQRIEFVEGYRKDFSEIYTNIKTR